jgi:Flp pilus assembly protein TadB
MVEDPEPPSGKRSRLEDEVLEILYRSDRPPTLGERFRASLRRTSRSIRTRRSGFFGNLGARMDSGMWLAVFVVLTIVAFFVRTSSPFLARVLVVVCLAMLVLAIVRSFRRSDRGQLKTWRGRDIDFSPPTRPLWFDRVFRGQRRPPRR